MSHAGEVVRGRALDVSELPTVVYGHRSLMWWGTASMMTIEGTVFALAIAAYYYLRMHAHAWPMSSAPPDLLWGTLNTLVLLGSLVPNEITKKAAQKLDVKVTRIGLVVCLAFSFAFLVLRAFEYAALNVRWDENAYGSIVWMLLSLHTVHLFTDFWDSAVLTAVMFQEPLEGRRFVDVSESAVYWYFVVLAWLPIYAVLYWSPRAG